MIGDLIACSLFVLVFLLYVYLLQKGISSVVNNPHRPRITLSRSIKMPDNYIEDVATKMAIKRVRAAFEQQQEAMNARALKPHAADCPDPLTCTKENCFTYEPDKLIIVWQQNTCHKHGVHDKDCEIFGCDKEICFIWEPDKIRDCSEVVSIKTRKERATERFSNSLFWQHKIKDGKIELKELVARWEKFEEMDTRPRGFVEGKK